MTQSFAKNKIFILYIFGSAFLLKTWKDYENFPKEDFQKIFNWSTIQLTNADPLICKRFREIQTNVELCSKAYENLFRGTRFDWMLFKIAGEFEIARVNYFEAQSELHKELFLKKLKRSDISTDLNLKEDHYFNLRKQIEAHEISDAILYPPTKELAFGNSNQGLISRVLSKLASYYKEEDYQSLINEIELKLYNEYIFIQEKENKLNYFAVGNFFADMLFKEEFICFTISDLSFFLFQLFYYNYFDKTHIGVFFQGFFQSLNEPQTSEATTEFRKHLLFRFLMVNLVSFLEIDFTLAKELVDLFHWAESAAQMEILFSDFSQFYSFFLYELKSFNKNYEGTLDGYWRLFGHDKLLFLSEIAKNFGAYSTIFGYKYLKGLLIDSTGLAKLSKMVIDDEVKNLNAYITDLISQIFSLENKVETKTAIFSLFKDEKKISTRSLKGFLEKFANDVKVLGRYELCDTVNALRRYKKENSGSSANEKENEEEEFYDCISL